MSRFLQAHWVLAADAVIFVALVAAFIRARHAVRRSAAFWADVERRQQTAAARRTRLECDEHEGCQW